MHATIFHNPACSNSRNALALLRERGIEPKIVDYLQTPPSVERLAGLVAAMGITPRELLRSKEPQYAELGLDDAKWTDAQLIAQMARHPVLMNRPIVETPHGTRLCRPGELVLDLLGPGQA
ncbi:arsenate reductase (glutaredoxin) [Pseudorhodoferax sp. Leaf274]|uniref:arsenate reductase (glutaredoxin) n=1 Tax=Pseudorhodoferax sp. Leaf274 TaxID=1736318 RepID=UPI0007025584|nr:arsenate reductase (glutaredoxin) [Pseudorhodoferax sp. Leaf274]KQP37390.1 arsenate reductase [Pseudorhodoferax sp. Leaf274]